MMIEVFAAIALNLATTTAGLAASADESPVAPSKNGIPSLAPILNKITQAVVNIETKGRMSPDLKSGERFHHVGSGVVYDAQRGSSSPTIMSSITRTL